MKELVIISGKGGTGKTITAASFISLFCSANKHIVIVDCDVDAPDLHLLLSPTVRERYEYFGMSVAKIDGGLCIKCGVCEKNCRFGAILNFNVLPYKCEGCALCYRLCPVGAIKMSDVVAGEWFVSDTKFGVMIHGKLRPGAANSGKLVAAIRRRADEMARALFADLIIIDGPPGIGCPVIASLTGTDFAVVVVEPTPSSIHDMDRAVLLLQHFGIKFGVVINKWDINVQNADKIERYCARKKIAMLGKVPYDEHVRFSVIAGLPLPEYREKCKAATAISDIWHRVAEILSL